MQRQSVANTSDFNTFCIHANAKFYKHNSNTISNSDNNIIFS